MLQAIVECQAAGRLEDALILTRALQESINHLLTHYEIMRVVSPGPDSAAAKHLRTARNASAAQPGSSKRPLRSNKVVLSNEGCDYLEKQKERARTSVYYVLLPMLSVHLFTSNGLYFLLFSFSGRLVSTVIRSNAIPTERLQQMLQAPQEDKPLESSLVNQP